MENYWIKDEWLDIETADEVRDALYRIATEEHRAPTLQERKWLKMRRACKRLAVPRQEYAMAAAKDGFNERIESAAVDTKLFDFVTDDAIYHVSVEVTAIPNEEPDVTITMDDQNGNGVSHGHIIFPGINETFEADDDGRVKISYVKYEKYIQTVMKLQCAISNGEPMNLTLQ